EPAFTGFAKGVAKNDSNSRDPPVTRVKALYDFAPSEPSELGFSRGDIITVIDSVYKDWWRGELRGRTGIFPVNYIEKLPDPTPADLAREAEIEASVFAESKNIEKLLQMLTTIDPNRDNFSENEEIQNLYHSTLAVRPKLVKLIEKYSQKKDELIALNEKFTKARTTYDKLYEVSIDRYKYNTPYGYSAPTDAYSPYNTITNSAYPTPPPTTQYDTSTTYAQYTSSQTSIYTPPVQPDSRQGAYYSSQAQVQHALPFPPPTQDKPRQTVYDTQSQYGTAPPVDVSTQAAPYTAGNYSPITNRDQPQSTTYASPQQQQQQLQPQQLQPQQLQTQQLQPQQLQPQQLQPPPPQQQQLHQQQLQQHSYAYQQTVVQDKLPRQDTYDTQSPYGATPSVDTSAQAVAYTSQQEYM
ncbi:6562_t:CDS:2, partial [Paraglomus occultum]